MKRKLLSVLVAGALASLGATAQAAQGPSSSQTPYATPTAAGWDVTSIITVGDSAANGYRMVGTPDGLGAYDNGNGTFTVLMNHEIGPGSGIARAHGANGAFVSEWIINKSDFRVLAGADLATSHLVWNDSGYSTATGAANSFNRLCSADLPAVTAFYNASTGQGTQTRIFMKARKPATKGGPTPSSPAVPTKARPTNCRSWASSPGRTAWPIPTRATRPWSSASTTQRRARFTSTRAPRPMPVWTSTRPA